MSIGDSVSVETAFPKITSCKKYAILCPVLVFTCTCIDLLFF